VLPVSRPGVGEGQSCGLSIIRSPIRASSFEARSARRSHPTNADMIPVSKLVVLYQTQQVEQPLAAGGEFVA
jgi:hypothetical protein